MDGSRRTEGNLLGSTPKDHSAQCIAEALGFLWIGGFAEALGKLEKLQLSDLFRLDALAY